MEIKLKGLTKIFPGNPKKHIKDTVAVSELNLTVPDGKLVGLLGPSGCGKSTTLYMISGLQIPTSGEVWFGEEEVTNLSPEKRGIGLVFQNYALYPNMNVYNNIAFPLINRHEKKEVIKEKVTSISKVLQIEDILGKKVDKISGGQKQRVAIGRALVKSPSLLLLDEPLSNLDALLRSQMRNELHNLHSKLQKTMIYVTHDQTEAYNGRSV